LFLIGWEWVITKPERDGLTLHLNKVNLSGWFSRTTPFFDLIIKVFLKGKELQSDKNKSAEKFAVKAADIAGTRHCKDITILNLTNLSPATNFFVIATGTSDRQMRAIADEIIDEGKECEMNVFGKAGYEHAKWILLDFVDVVVHLFNEDFREYYNLEMLWGDAEKIEHKKTKNKIS
jgi:ribosome-associated protein